MIKIYEKNKISPKKFYEEHIKKNRPCVIKNFYNETDTCYNYYIDNLKNTKSFKIGYVDAHIIKSNCLNNFMKEIEKVTFIKKKTRLWKHNKGNITVWHYDGNGHNVINICLSGRKRFYMSPPSSIPVYPLSNIAIDYNWDGEYVEIEKYDLLYIPSYWFHKVVSLEDNTITINHSFFHNTNNLYASNRDLYLYTIHKYLNSKMCVNDIICDVTKEKPLLYCILFGLYEISWIYIIMSLIFLFIYKYNLQLYKILCIVSFIAVIYLFTDNYINDVSSGITKLVSLYLFIFLILINIVIKFMLQ